MKNEKSYYNIPIRYKGKFIIGTAKIYSNSYFRPALPTFYNIDSIETLTDCYYLNVNTNRYTKLLFDKPLEDMIECLMLEEL